MKFIYLIFLILPFGVFAQSMDCSKFKTGTFKYTDPKLEHQTIIRNDSLQIEIDEKSNIKITALVEWLSDCKYKLTYKKVSNPSNSLAIGTSFNVNITSVTNNTYKYTAYDNTRKMDGEIIKIKE